MGRIGGVVGGARYVASPVFAPVVPVLAITSIGGGAISQFAQAVSIELIVSPLPITSVTIGGVAHTIASQTAGGGGVRTVVLARIEALGASGNKSVLISDGTSTASATVAYTRTHVNAAPAPGSYDSNSAFYGSEFPAGSYFNYVTGPAGFLFKLPYSGWHDAPLENDINDYLVAPVGTSGTFNWQFEIVTPSGLTGSWIASTTVQPPLDTTPNAFAFDAIADAPRATAVLSDAIVVAGINAPSPISVQGGEYRINGGSWRVASGTVAAGDAVQVRHVSAATYSTLIETILTIGGVEGRFASTTVALVVDVTPDPFSFPPVANAPLVSTVESVHVTVTGTNTAAPISVNLGEYRINNGAWRTAAGMVEPGDSVQVRHTSSAIYGGSVVSVLTIGGVAAAFTSITVVVLSNWGLTGVLADVDTGAPYANLSGLVISVRSHSDAESTLYKTTAGTTDINGRFTLRSTSVETTVGVERVVTIEKPTPNRIIWTYVMQVVAL